MQARVRGCANPLSPIQVATASMGVVNIALAIVIFSLYSDASVRGILLGTYCGLAAVVVTCYFVCSFSDVTKSGGVPCLCMRDSQSRSVYCGTCRAMIPGFDHHCAVRFCCPPASLCASAPR